MAIAIESSWEQALAKEFASDWFSNISEFIKGEYAAGKRIYPAPGNIFKAFNSCPIDNVKVVILGQDPYHQPGQAQGLSFSVPGEVKNPPSLVNIFKEIESSMGNKAQAETDYKGDLTYWAEQGVLLLNSALTVEHDSAGSHSDIGWHQLTDAAIRAVSQRGGTRVQSPESSGVNNGGPQDSEPETPDSGVVFMLWGKHARTKAELIDSDKHLVLEAPHPSPLSAHRGFFGCNHFTKCDDYLSKKGTTPIAW